MSQPNDSYIEALNQIRERQIAVLEEIDRVREKHHNSIPAELERIQGEALRIVHDLEEISERQETELLSRAAVGQMRYSIASSRRIFLQ